jgi:exopolysaccharide biosynthesis polyprenyl glycosylphosphotransferase
MTEMHGVEPDAIEQDAVEPDAIELPGRNEISPATERSISIFVQPEVALHQTRVRIARRHLARQVARVLSLAAGDAVAAACAALAVGQLVAWLAAVLGHGRTPYSSTAEFCGALLLSLALTGNYQRLTPHPTLHLLIGSSLGTLVVCWSNFWARPTIGAVPVAVLLAVVTTGFLFLIRGALNAIAGWLLPEHRRLVPAVVVSAGPGVDATLEQSSGYRVAGRLVLDRRSDDSRAQELARLIRQSRAESVILFGSVEPKQFTRFLEISLNAGCEVLCAPPALGVAGVRPSVTWHGPYSLIQVQPPTLKAPQVIAKRCVDVVLSCLALVVAAPLGLLIAVAIKLDSPGPVFFLQDRVGIGGRRFKMVKFRTMRAGADAEKARFAHLNTTGDSRLFKIPDDPRISRVGRHLRRWSLDELPQFLNVIVGHMSLVGPRPFFETDFADYEEHHFRRLGAKPGITGLWQVYGRSTVLDFEEVVRLDTEYIDRWSLWLDIKILVSTLPAVIRRTGAY